MSEEEFDPSRPIEEALAEGVRLFNAGEYEESHEEFEHGWLSSEANDSEFFKGLVQAGICLHKLQQGQHDGAEKLHAGMRRYLAAYLPSHRGVDVEGLMKEMRSFLDTVDWSRAPRMKVGV